MTPLQETAYLSTPDFATLTIIKLIENFQFRFQVRPTKRNRREANLLMKYQTYNNQGMQGNLSTLCNKFTNSDNCKLPKKGYENSYAFKKDRDFKYTIYIYVIYGDNVGLYWIKTTKIYDRSRIRNLVLCAFNSDGTNCVRYVPPVQHIARHTTY